MKAEALRSDAADQWHQANAHRLSFALTPTDIAFVFLMGALARTAHQVAHCRRSLTTYVWKELLLAGYPPQYREALVTAGITSEITAARPLSRGELGLTEAELLDACRRRYRPNSELHELHGIKLLQPAIVLDKGQSPKDSVAQPLHESSDVMSPPSEASSTSCVGPLRLTHPGAAHEPSGVTPQSRRKGSVAMSRTPRLASCAEFHSSGDITPLEAARASHKAKVSGDRDQLKGEIEQYITWCAEAKRLSKPRPERSPERHKRALNPLRRDVASSSARRVSDKDSPRRTSVDLVRGTTSSLSHLSSALFEDVLKVMVLSEQQVLLCDVRAVCDRDGVIQAHANLVDCIQRAAHDLQWHTGVGASPCRSDSDARGDEE